jgi:hypothetical protein
MLIRLSIIILPLICFNQSYCQAGITIYNRSSTDIDSVVVDGNKAINFGGIKNNSKKFFFVNGDQANFHSFAPFYMKVFTKGHVFSKQWMKTGFSGIFYFYDHGINDVDTPLLKPRTFRLLVFNATQRHFDSIFTQNNAILEIIELSPRKREIVFDHEKANSSKKVSFKLGDTILNANLNYHAFDNWADTLSSLYVENDSIFIGLRTGKPAIEYVVDLYLQGVSIESVQVQSNSVIKTYDWVNDFIIKRIVFDYEKLKSDPKIKIKVNKKRHVVTLNENDLKYEDKFYFVSKDKIW